MLNRYRYDVFISYSHKDSRWVLDWLLPRLKDAGLVVCINLECFEPGAPSATEIERATRESRKTLLVLTPNWVASEWTEFESLLVHHFDPSARRRRLIPILLEPCTPPDRIAILNWVDFTDPEKQSYQLRRVVDAIRGSSTLPELWTETSNITIPVPPKPYFAHPHPLQANFTGRIDERRTLTEWLTSGSEPILALVAIGGMGKSALTWYWLTEDVPKGGYQLDGILWWSFYGPESRFIRFLDEAVTYVSGGAVELRTVSSLYEKTRVLGNLLQARRILLVLDGFERELRAYANLCAAYQDDDTLSDTFNVRTCIDPYASNFLRWLASAPVASKLLLTSRLFPADLEGPDGQPLAGCRRIELGSMASDDAVTFFRAQGVSKGTRAAIQLSCELYGYHPLSLRLLSGLITRDKHAPGDIATAPKYSVMADLKARRHHVLETAYNALPDDLRTLLSRLAAFRHPVGYEAVAVSNTLGDEARFDAALEELITRELLSFDKERVRYDLHPVVRAYAYDRLADKKEIHSRLRDYFAAVPVPDTDRVRSVNDLVPVIELYYHTVRAGGYREARALLRDWLRDVLHYQIASYQTENEMLLLLLPEDRSSVPLDNPSDQYWTFDALAKSFGKLGNIREAVRYKRLAAYLADNVGDNTNAAVLLRGLAYYQTLLGLFRDAQSSLQRCLAMHKDKLELAVWHKRYGVLLAYRGEFDKAESELRTGYSLLASVETHYSSKVEHRVQEEKERSTLYLSSLYLLSKRPIDAEKELNDTSTGVLLSQSRFARNRVWYEWLLALTLLALTTTDEAERHASVAVRLCRRINLVELEPDTMLALARVRHYRGDFQEAASLANEALQISDRCGYRIQQADIHNFLAGLALDCHDFPKARRHAEIARASAWCDGPPYSYKPGLDTAEHLLVVAGQGE